MGESGSLPVTLPLVDPVSIPSDGVEPVRLWAFLVLVPDWIDTASDESMGAPSFPVTRSAEEVLGLSDDTLPGILLLMELRNERDDSFVSERENEGYFWKPGSPPSPLEGWLPMVDSVDVFVVVWVVLLLLLMPLTRLVV